MKHRTFKLFASTVVFSRFTIDIKNFGKGVPISDRFSKIEINSLMINHTVTIIPKQQLVLISIPQLINADEIM